MSVTGDFNKARLLEQGLARAGAKGAAVFANYAAAEMAKLTRGQGRRAESPDGAPWAPLVRAPRPAGRKKARLPRKPLRGIVEGATAIYEDGGTARVSLPKPGAKFSQRGTRRQVQRQIVPLTGEPLPERWRRRILTRTTFVVWKLIKGGL